MSENNRLPRKSPSGPFTNLAADAAATILYSHGAPVTITAGDPAVTLYSVTITPAYGDTLCGTVYVQANITTGTAGSVTLYAALGGAVRTLLGLLEAPAAVVARAPMCWAIPFETATPLLLEVECSAATDDGVVNSQLVQIQHFGRATYI